MIVLGSDGIFDVLSDAEAPKHHRPPMTAGTGGFGGRAGACVFMIVHVCSEGIGVLKGKVAHSKVFRNTMGTEVHMFLCKFGFCRLSKYGT